VKHIGNILLLLSLSYPLASAQGPAATEPDARGCVDSRTLPKLPSCRIDNCELKRDDQRDVPVREDEKGEAVLAAIDGDSRSVMYECREGMAPETVVQEAVAALKAATIPVLYQFVGSEGTVTARKGDTWLLVEAAAHYYTLVELKAVPPDFASITDASGFCDAIDRYGHVPIYGVHFLPGRPELAPSSEAALKEVAIMLEAHPEWRFRIESHSSDVGTKMANMTLTAGRASAVAGWLVNYGIRRVRLEPMGMGDTHPVAENTTEAGRAKNDRVDLIRIVQN
jgi:outer membrane protein OmpA-like peptidoglycan-associated protein